MPHREQRSGIGPNLTIMSDRCLPLQSVRQDRFRYIAHAAGELAIDKEYVAKLWCRLPLARGFAPWRQRAFAYAVSCHSAAGGK